MKKNTKDSSHFLDIDSNFELKGYLLHLTCAGEPEQYDVFRADDKGMVELPLAQLRLRGGRFTASIKDEGTVYFKQGVNGSGRFLPEERMKYIGMALTAVSNYYKRKAKQKE